MEIIYVVSTGTNDISKNKQPVESVIPFLPRTTFNVKGKNEMECFNKISTFFKSLYFEFDGIIEECIEDNNISFILTKWIYNEYYCRAINVRAIRIVKDEIYYL